jgi:hypothetical protein
MQHVSCRLVQTCSQQELCCFAASCWLLQNWGKEVVKWLGDRMDTVVVDDTKADKVKKSLQVGPLQLFMQSMPQQESRSSDVQVPARASCRAVVQA